MNLSIGTEEPAPLKTNPRKKQKNLKNVAICVVFRHACFERASFVCADVSLFFKRFKTPLPLYFNVRRLLFFGSRIYPR